MLKKISFKFKRLFCTHISEVVIDESGQTTGKCNKCGHKHSYFGYNPFEN